MTQQLFSHIDVPNSRLLESAYEASGHHSGGIGVPLVVGPDADAQTRAFADYVGDGTNDAAQLNLAIAALPSFGGLIRVKGNFTVEETIEWVDGVIIEGDAEAPSIFTAKTSLNANMFQTNGFATDTGSGDWFVDTEGVHYGFGLKNISIDGNKANQTSGNGIAIFGKGYIIENVLIRDVQDVGFYSEAGATTGQHDWRDRPEAKIRNLTVSNSGSHGVQYLGPHDGIFNNIVSYDNGAGGSGDDFHIDSAAGYNGSCIVDTLHTYGGVAQRGAYINATCQMSKAYIETAVVTGLLIASNNFALSNLYLVGSSPTGMDVQGNNVNISDMNVNGDMTTTVITVSGDLVSIRGDLSFNNNAGVVNQIVWEDGADSGYLNVGITNGQASGAQLKVGNVDNCEFHMRGQFFDGKILDLSGLSTGERNLYFINGSKGPNATDWDDSGEPIDARDFMVYSTQTKQVFQSPS